AWTCGKVIRRITIAHCTIASDRPCLTWAVCHAPRPADRSVVGVLGRTAHWPPRVPRRRTPAPFRPSRDEFHSPRFTSRW
ncbi:hypothetical protein DQE84_19125, partial [Staphylococcus warneri]